MARNRRLDRRRYAGPWRLHFLWSAAARCRFGCGALHAHRMIGFLEVTGREDPSWGQIRKKAVLSRVLCAISAALLLLALLMVVTLLIFRALGGRTVPRP